MSYPAGVTTRPVSFGPAIVLEDGTPLKMQVSIRASRALVWLANGAPFVDVGTTIDGDQVETQLPLPVTDQEGYGDGRGNAIDVTDGKHSHYYTATVSYLLGKKEVKRITAGPFALPTDDGSPIDLDNLIPVSTAGGATIAIPDTWSATLDEARTMLEQKGSPGGLAPLDEAGKLPEGNVPERLSEPMLKATFVAPEGTPDDGDAIVWNAAASAWKPSPVEGGVPGLAERVTVLEENTPTLEEQALSVVLDSGEVSAEQTRAAFVAQFPCEVQQVSLVFGAAVAASDTDYWTLTLVRYHDGDPATVATKTTKATGGEAVAAFRDWNFDTTPLSNTGLVKGSVLAVIATPTGTPGPLVSPCLTFRAPAADVEPPEPAADIIDTFDRADSTSGLGNADTGQAWGSSNPAGITFGIDSGTAYLVSGPSAANVAWIDSGTGDVTVELTFVAIPTNGSAAGIAIRADSGSNFILARNDKILKRVAGGAWTDLAVYTDAFVNGDRMRAECVGDSITIYRQAGAVGEFVEVASVTESHNQTVTTHGVLFHSTANEARFDDFKVWAWA